MNRLKSIVVGVDYSDCARTALAQAVRMAHWNQAALHVLHVIDSSVVQEFAEATGQSVAQAGQHGSQVHFLHVFQGPWRRLRYLAPTPGTSPDFEKQYRAALEGRLREFVGQVDSPEPRFALYEATNHGHGIAEFARQVRADLILLGTRGRTNLKYLLLGSTVERLLREVPCSVLAVRAVD